jgi:hypothetical protein
MTRGQHIWREKMSHDNPFVATLDRAERIIAQLYDALWKIEMVIRIPDLDLTEPQRLEKIMNIINEARNRK